MGLLAPENIAIETGVAYEGQYIFLMENTVFSAPNNGPVKHNRLEDSGLSQSGIAHGVNRLGIDEKDIALI